MLQDSATPTALTAGEESPTAARARRITKKTAEFEGIDVAATNGLANLQQFVESFSHSRNYF
ncbi:MAG: hypothetical protein ING66_13365 [Rhodocyclaceae bacterium]|jgi:hypothetical protein|nr:hypothetical protein [Rhodocyclaceae bacterium]MCA3025134.1 hypothetical protein [Rhodocyclaceae bacterium]MCA3029569.1 hypothetical protein [Rhodocyclaceae bacterium]MCA3032125.1 hypothetical protein [Rhodocyclaceae bacterium]MCA3038659.1 hypothetical protein [Rhodocyclaceae bacterium]